MAEADKALTQGLVPLVSRTEAAARSECCALGRGAGYGRG